MTELPREEVAAAMAARRELGDDYEDAIAAGLADKIEAEIERRSGGRPPVTRQADQLPRTSSGHALALGIVSLGASIPLTAIALALGRGNQLVFVVVIWLAIVAVNVAFNRRR